jgi:hypothetical protein
MRRGSRYGVGGLHGWEAILLSIVIFSGGCCSLDILLEFIRRI